MAVPPRPGKVLLLNANSDYTPLQSPACGKVLVPVPVRQIPRILHYIQRIQLGELIDVQGENAFKSYPGGCRFKKDSASQ